LWVSHVVSRGIAVDVCPTSGKAADNFPFTLIGDHIYVDAIVKWGGALPFYRGYSGINLIDAALAKSLSLTVAGMATILRKSFTQQE
jgi:hypothetical protein